MITKYPNLYDAPTSLLLLGGNCGLITTWSVCKYFHKRVSSSEIVKLCRYSNRQGVYTITMAVALHKLGLTVSFHTDPDPAPRSIERQSYKAAESLGLSVLPAINLNALITEINVDKIAIVLYQEEEGAHFSPLLGIKKDRLILPYSNMAEMKRDDFTDRWDIPDICRQCILVSRKRY